MRGKSLVRIHGPGMHSSGPRPKSHCGSPTAMSLPTLIGDPQFNFAVPAGELPVGWHTRPSCCPFKVLATLPLLKITTRSPFGMGMGSEPWSLLHLFGASVGSKSLPPAHKVVE